MRRRGGVPGIRLLACLVAWCPSVHAQEPEVPPADPATLEAAEQADPPVGPVAPPEEPPPLRKPEADFLVRHVELKVRIAFNGAAAGPFTLFTSLGGWNEFGVSVDAGFRSWRDFTIGMGGTVWYGQAGILGASIQRIANYDKIQFRWNMWETGGTYRTTFHYTPLASLDPYLFGGIGGGAFQVEARVQGWPRVPPERHISGYLRLEAGGGITTRIRGGNWVIGGELRYMITAQFQGVQQLVLTRSPEETATFVLFPQHHASRGFSWVIQVGYRW